LCASLTINHKLIQNTPFTTSCPSLPKRNLTKENPKTDSNIHTYARKKRTPNPVIPPTIIPIHPLPPPEAAAVTGTKLAGTLPFIAIVEVLIAAVAVTASSPGTSIAIPVSSTSVSRVIVEIGIQIVSVLPLEVRTVGV
jgi:hypothetical protein